MTDEDMQSDLSTLMGDVPGSTLEPVPAGDNARATLRRCIEAIEAIEEQKKELQDDIKDQFSTLKSVGFDTTLVREVLKLRKKDMTEVRERQLLLAKYLEAIGMDV